MKGIVHRRAGAQRDLIAIYRRYAREAGLYIPFSAHLASNFREFPD